jgi:multidrug efflux pump subunit AcrB
MGVRAGVLIGSSLLFSILGTLFIMRILGIDLHRTSLAAIIIAMGMLVDNAIVVTDNAMMSMKRGMPRAKAFITGASIPQWGLLGATFIAIISFLPLYLAPNNTAEIIKPLFVVLAISLILSWIFALIQTTTFGDFIFKEPKKDAVSSDPYDKKFYIKLRAFIERIIQFKWISLGLVVAVFVISIFSFGYVKQSFFPPIDKPMFRFDYWVAQGTSLSGVEEDIKKIEDYLLARDDVRKVSTSLGASPLRYYLASISVSTRTNYGHLLVELDDYRSTDRVMAELKQHVMENFPNAVPIIYKFKVSPHPEATVEATFEGPDPAVLRDLAEQAKEIMRNEPIVELVRDSWGEKTMVWTPVYSQTKGQQAGVSRENMASTMLRITDGQNVGEYREGDDIIPILIKDVNRKNYNYGNLGSLPIYNSNSEAVSLDRVVEGYDLDWENLNIRRYNRQRSIAAQCDPILGYENTDAEALLMPLIEQIELPEGYRLWWDGIYEDQTASQKAIGGQLPMALVLIISILIILFNSYKKTLAILLMIPLILIGVVFGFLISGLPFGFFAILGLLGLIGMVVKNAIVLIDQANLEMKENNKTPYESIVLAAQSRAVPVAMAAGTTVLGMTPLLPDPMFGGMAATIMGGLVVATLLTILVLPVIYSALYGLSKKKQGAKMIIEEGE